MADNTAIEWCDATWNIVTGCSVVSPGCTNCYAMRLAGTRLKHQPSRAGLTIESKSGPVWNGQVRFNKDWLDQPLGWRRSRHIFVCAHGDLFHEAVPDAWIDQVFAVMALAPQHIFLVLTKRATRMRQYLCERIERQGRAFTRSQCIDVEILIRTGERGVGYIEEGSVAWPLPNVWLGVSIEDQARADQRIPDLLAAPAAKRFISAEPLLGPIDLTRVPYIHPWDCPTPPAPDATSRSRLNSLSGWAWGEDLVDGSWVNWRDGDEDPRHNRVPRQHRALDWVIAGGESGPGARPMHPDWPRALRDQCAAAGVPYFFDQWGEYGSREYTTFLSSARETRT